MSDNTKMVLLTVVARVPSDFFAETHIYGLDTRAGWVNDIWHYSGVDLPTDLPGEPEAA